MDRLTKDLAPTDADCHLIRDAQRMIEAIESRCACTMRRKKTSMSMRRRGRASASAFGWTFLPRPEAGFTQRGRRGRLQGFAAAWSDLQEGSHAPRAAIHLCWQPTESRLNAPSKIETARLMAALVVRRLLARAVSITLDIDDACDGLFPPGAIETG
jgi:hypothetical protein